MVFAIDVAMHDFVAALQVRPGEILARFKWQHPQKTRSPLAGVAQLQARGPVEAVLESSGTYGDALRGQLQALGVAVYRVSAKRVHDAAEVFDGGRRCRDTFASLKKTCRKLRISFWDDLNDRIGQVDAIPSLPEIVRERILAAQAVP